MDAVSLTLPWPPSVNTYWRYVGQRVLISAPGRAYRKTVGELVLIARARRQLSLAPLLGAIAIRIEATPPDHRVRDIDNLLKAPLDAITAAGVWGDDSQITELTVVKLAPGAGSIRVIVSEAMQRAA